MKFNRHAKPRDYVIINIKFSPKSTQVRRHKATSWCRLFWEKCGKDFCITKTGKNFWNQLRNRSRQFAFERLKTSHVKPLFVDKQILNHWLRSVWISTLRFKLYIATAWTKRLKIWIRNATFMAWSHWPRQRLISYIGFEKWVPHLLIIRTETENH